MGLFEGQVAWVTGAGRGIGRAVAVALVSCTQNEAEQTAEEIRAGRDVVVLAALRSGEWVRG